MGVSVRLCAVLLRRRPDMKPVRARQIRKVEELTRTWPVTQLAASLNKNTVAFATSPIWPHRCRGMSLMMVNPAAFFSSSDSLAPSRSIPSVPPMGPTPSAHISAYFLIFKEYQNAYPEQSHYFERHVGLPRQPEPDSAHQRLLWQQTHAPIKHLRIKMNNRRAQQYVLAKVCLGNEA